MREIKEGVVACGYYNSSKVNLFEGGAIKHSFEVGINSFGLVLAPSWDPTWSDETLKTSPKFIALGNDRFVSVYSTAEDDQ